MTRCLVLVGLLSAAGCHLPQASAEPPDKNEQAASKTRSERWQSRLENEEFRFPDCAEGVLWSLGQYLGNCKIHMIYDPEHRTVAFRFERDGKQLVELHGNMGSSFATESNVLFFAEFPPRSCGCTIVAYDLDMGKKLWETRLKAVGQVPHSGYINRVVVQRGPVGDDDNDQVLRVTGSESYGDYREILDMKTGEILAHKVYREGYK